MTGELIATGNTFDIGRIAINNAFSGTSLMNNIKLDSGGNFSGGTGGGILFSGGTDLYNIFLTSASDSTTASNGLVKTGDNITLGGSLTADTTIIGGGFSLNTDTISASTLSASSLNISIGNFINLNTDSTGASDPIAGFHFREGVGEGFNGFGANLYYMSDSGTLDRLIMTGLFSSTETGGLFVQRNDGNIGIGMNLTTGTTSNTLQIGETNNLATLKFVDGNQQTDYALISDADGVASWKFNGGSLFTSSTGSNSLVTKNGTGNIASATRSIAFGRANTATFDDSAVFGGWNSTATNFRAGVFCGYNGDASGSDSFVGAGYNGIASGARASSIGGFGLTASGNQSFAAGGQNNSAVGIGSVAIGGTGNTVNGDGSAILCGKSNTIGSGGKRSSILAGSVITANSPDTAFAQRLYTDEYIDYNPQTTLPSPSLGRLFFSGTPLFRLMICTGSTSSDWIIS